MCCSLMAIVREIYFFANCFWAVGYFTGRRLNLRITGANNKMNRSGMAQHYIHWSHFLPCGSLARLGAINLVVVSAAGAAVLAEACWGNRLGRRNKMWFSGFQSHSALCWEQRTERLQAGFLFARAVFCDGRVLFFLQSPATNVSFPPLSSAISHMVLSIPGWGFPFPEACVSQAGSSRSSVA